eukprot:4941117-Alexandrium_andersonii.AAC.1
MRCAVGPWHDVSSSTVACVGNGNAYNPPPCYRAMGAAVAMPCARFDRGRGSGRPCSPTTHRGACSRPCAKLEHGGMHFSDTGGTSDLLPRVGGARVCMQIRALTSTEQSNTVFTSLLRELLERNHVPTRAAC